MLTTMQMVQRLGVSPLEALTIEAVIEHSGVLGAAAPLGKRRETISMRMFHLKQKLRLSSTMHVCLLYDRIRRGASNSDAMEGLK